MLLLERAVYTPQERARFIWRRFSLANLVELILCQSLCTRLTFRRKCGQSNIPSQCNVVGGEAELHAKCFINADVEFKYIMENSS